MNIQRHIKIKCRPDQFWALCCRRSADYHNLTRFDCPAGLHHCDPDTRTHSTKHWKGFHLHSVVSLQCFRHIISAMINRTCSLNFRQVLIMLTASGKLLYSGLSIKINQMNTERRCVCLSYWNTMWQCSSLARVCVCVCLFLTWNITVRALPRRRQQIYLNLWKWFFCVLFSGKLGRLIWALLSFSCLYLDRLKTLLLFAVCDILTSQLRPKANRGRYKYTKARWSALRKLVHKLTQISACDDPLQTPLPSFGSSLSRLQVKPGAAERLAKLCRGFCWNR